MNIHHPRVTFFFNLLGLWDSVLVNFFFGKSSKTLENVTLFGTYCKSSIKTPRGLFTLSLFEEGRGLIETEGLIQFRKDDGTRIQSGKAQVQEVRGHAVEDQNPNFQLVNKLSRIRESTRSFTVVID